LILIPLHNKRKEIDIVEVNLNIFMGMENREEDSVNRKTKIPSREDN
jgi:hypothetical protein